MQTPNATVVKPQREEQQQNYFAYTGSLAVQKCKKIENARSRKSVPWLCVCKNIETSLSALSLQKFNKRY